MNTHRDRQLLGRATVVSAVYQRKSPSPVGPDKIFPFSIVGIARRAARP
jgi:hypothetical protein